MTGGGIDVSPLQPLTAAYYHFTFGPDVNGINIVLLNGQYGNPGVNIPPTVKITAFWRTTQGTWSKPIQWRPSVDTTDIGTGLCMNLPAAGDLTDIVNQTRAKDLVLVISNSSYGANATTFDPKYLHVNAWRGCDWPDRINSMLNVTESSDLAYGQETQQWWAYFPTHNFEAHQPKQDYNVMRTALYQGTQIAANVHTQGWVPTGDEQKCTWDVTQQFTFNLSFATSWLSATDINVSANVYWVEHRDQVPVIHAACGVDVGVFVPYFPQFSGSAVGWPGTSFSSSATAHNSNPRQDATATLAITG